MAQRKKSDPEKMNASIETKGTRNWAATKHQNFQRTSKILERYVKYRQKSSRKTLKPKLRRKQVVCSEAESERAKHYLWMEIKFLA
jgi:hypothetical protein